MSDNGAKYLDRTTIHDLPYEMLREIFTSLPGIDIFNTITTCRALYKSFNADEYVWQELALRYGVTDRALFEGRTFRTIYTRLLHPYGALLGLWASDHPFRGNIMEYRIAPNRWGGKSHLIVGEVWRFPFARTLLTGQRGEPSLPQYIEFMQIGFGLEEEDDADVVCTTWHIHADRSPRDPTVPYDRRDRGHRYARPIMHLIHSYHEPILLQDVINRGTGRSTFPHPDFPASNEDGWLDTRRGRPLVEGMEVSNSLMTSSLGDTETRALALMMEGRYTGQASGSLLPAEFHQPRIRKPVGLSFYGLLTIEDGLMLHRPIHSFHDPREDTAPRYYPLRDDIEIGEDPTSADWHVESLRGLWLGSYGPHGTECVYLEPVPATSVVRARKITGDDNVPRGANTWVFQMDVVKTHQQIVDAKVPIDGDVDVVRAYAGSGTISALGYTEAKNIPVVVMITSKDDIRVAWKMSSIVIVSKFIRYRGRRSVADDTEDLG